MFTVAAISELRHQVAGWRRAGERVAFVPTMGNLHAGHMRLVEQARQLGDRVVVSIFVNPTQFSPGEDLHHYPRTPAEDQKKLQAGKADLLFMPSVEAMYPNGADAVTEVHVPGLEDILCGEFRPGHFCGVATVVARLFNLVQPDVAVFGEKDWQQLLVIRRMVEELAFAVEIIGVATIREADGLALSSRNRYFSPQDRSRAPALHAALAEVAEALRSGHTDYAALERTARDSLAHAGFGVEYLVIRRADDLAEPGSGDTRLAVLAAARLGSVRLIDNIVLTTT